VKVTAVLGTTLLCLTRIVVASTQDLSTLKMVVLGVSPLAEGLLAPTCMVGIKKLTEEKDRSMVYSLQYAGHNLAGAISDLVIDVVRQHRPAAGTQLFGVPLTMTRSCLFLSEAALLTSVCCALVLPRSLGPSCHAAAYKEFSENDPKPGFMQDLLSLLRSPNLLRVALISTSLTFTKSQWHHMNATMPKYLIREIDQDVPWGSVNSINFWMCALLPPVVQWALLGWRDLPCVIIGSIVMGVAPIFMVFEVSVRAACLWLIVMSIGEVIWSPRMVTLTANLSPAGREGVFLVLANAPTFLAGVPTGWMSGELLRVYCPDCPTCRESGGDFCSVPSALPLDVLGNDTMQALRCESRAEGGSCLDRQWGSLSSCPSSCAMCPGWTSDGRMVWLWILIFSVVGPFFLAVVQKRFFVEEEDQAPVVPPKLFGKALGSFEQRHCDTF